MCVACFHCIVGLLRFSFPQCGKLQTTHDDDNAMEEPRMFFYLYIEVVTEASQKKMALKTVFHYATTSVGGKNRDEYCLSFLAIRITSNFSIKLLSPPPVEVRTTFVLICYLK